MRIAVIQHIKAGDYAEYLSSLINSQAKRNDYQVKIWSHSVPASQQFIDGNAIIYILMERNSRLTVKWWYTVKLPAILKKMKAKAILDLNGMAPVRVNISNIIALPQEVFSEKKQMRGVNKIIKEQIDRSVVHSAKALLHSNNKATVLRKDIAEPDKIDVVPFTAPPVFRTFEWHEKIMIKAQQADNKEYFIAILEDEAEESFVTLLKAFTKFKNWQQSNMQFLILPKYESFSHDIRQKLERYKHREDVRLLEDLEEAQIASVLASAYAMVLTCTPQPDLMALTAALQCSLPVISQHDSDVEEYAGDAALYISDTSFETLGDALIQLYKDEELHARLKEACKKRTGLFSRDEYETRLWELLQTAAYS